ncbi:MAG: hypothetical protein AB1505_36385 [Candidatus Latescibacterota bacterium]
MATRQLPPNPSLKSLKNQAKQLLHGHQAGRSDACERLRASHPRLAQLPLDAVKETEVALADALLVVAREYGFESWPKLVEGVFAQSEWPDFANPEGWEWVVRPQLNNPIGSCGCTSSENCSLTYENRPEDHALYIFFAAALAARPELAGRPIRAVAIDEQTRRHELPAGGGTRGASLATYSWHLPYTRVPHGAIWYLGTEAGKA